MCLSHDDSATLRLVSARPSPVQRLAVTSELVFGPVGHAPRRRQAAGKFVFASVCVCIFTQRRSDRVLEQTGGFKLSRTPKCVLILHIWDSGGDSCTCLCRHAHCSL